MRTVLLLLFFYSSSFVLAQDYHPFPQGEAVWSSLMNLVWYTDPEDGEILEVHDITIHYGIFGDTLINDQLYQKIYQSSESTFDINDAQYFGGIREEEKFIFLFGRFDHKEDTLYNFNLLPGDIWKDYDNYLGTRIIIQLESIDSIILLNETFRKRYNFRRISIRGGVADTIPSVQWIEGIGSIVNCSFFSPECFLSRFAMNHQTVLCFSEAGEKVFQNEAYESCYINTIDYQFLPNKNAVWSELSQKFDPDWNLIKETKRYFLKGDTTVSIRKYAKVFVTSDSIGFDNAVYLGGIRPDGKVIYWWPEGVEEEYVLYNFNLGIDDVVVTWDSCNPATPGCLFIQVIDTVRIALQDGEMRKALKLGIVESLGDGTVFDLGHFFHWIEGIGSDRGLLYHSEDAFTQLLPVDPLPLSPTLLCFQEEEVLKYLDQEFMNCYVSVINSVEDQELETLNVFPNPSNYNITIELPDALLGSHFCLFSLDGKRLLSGQLDRKENDLFISQLPNGIYLLNIFHEVGSYSFKVVKI